DAYHQAMHDLSDAPAEGPEHDRLAQRCSDLQHAIEVSGGWHLPQEIKSISLALRLPDTGRPLGSLSGGELRRVDLAVKLIQHPDVLILDEPTNHIDTRSVEWIEGFLENYAGSCILVTHDRYFLDRVVNRIVELEFSQVFSFPGKYDQFLEYKIGIEEQRAREETNRRAALRREFEWLRRGPKARTTKQKARIDRAMDLVEQGPPPRHREFSFAIPEPERLGKTILEARHVFHGFDERMLIRDFSFIMQKEMRVGIIGPNGSGKTTLLRVLMGMEEPRKGKVIHGERTQFLYVDQSHADVKPGQSILDFVSGGTKYWDVGKQRIYVPGYLEHFLFDMHSVMMPMGNLSGGERNRLDLARKLLRGGNFLVLDEPTNDLDLYTLRVVEEAIEFFEGCALIVSHDRYFLNRLCTHMLVFEGDGAIVQITGNYDDYLLYKERKAEEERMQEKEKEREAPAARPVQKEKPRRLTYKEKQELEGMEARIHAAEAEVDRLEKALQAPGFYEQGHAAVQAALDALEGAKAAVEALFARWEELEQIDQ
ncbi:MAG: ATP-binding cassette domain-containing protein, partial [Candidatus Hydrogenedentes bacterium]|nr:ATP-binding cassette domain-containing protein [Candidatus Hydrogenedentota bacterium]